MWNSFLNYGWACHYTLIASKGCSNGKPIITLNMPIAELPR
jgi:hypothetical protein